MEQLLFYAAAFAAGFAFCCFALYAVLGMMGEKDGPEPPQGWELRQQQHQTRDLQLIADHNSDGAWDQELLEGDIISSDDLDYDLYYE